MFRGGAEDSVVVDIVRAGVVEACSGVDVVGAGVVKVCSEVECDVEKIS